jgi:hypothetical protein
MHIVKINGGLGNQMFQYCFALALAKMGRLVYLDITAYRQKQVHNGFELPGIFGCRLEVMNESAKAHFFTQEGSYTRFRRDRQIIAEGKQHFYQYHPDLFELESAYFDGYWQCAAYVELLDWQQELVFPAIDGAIEPENAALEKELMHTNAVSVHIRRGDYVGTGYHRLLAPDYYDTAMSYCRANIPAPRFYVFSDDIGWARDNLIGEDISFVDWNKGKNSFRDMQLMSLCKHNIISNSTFSWWAAWLNIHPGKIVFSPASWFEGNEFDLDTFLPAEWHLI